MESARADLELAKWIIETQKSQIQKKRCDIGWLQRERDGHVKELEEQRKKLQSFELKLESAQATLNQAQE